MVTRASPYLFIVLVVAAVACATPLRAAAQGEVQSKSAVDVHERRLANGFKTLVKVDRRSPVVVSMVWYRVGSIDEANGYTGLSHVLEHMMFKGTGELAPGEFSKTIARAGGRDNAFTSKDYTAYHQRLPKEQLPLAIRLEADRMANLVLSEEEFAREIRVVMEERRQRVEDNPSALLYEQLFAAALMVNPERRPIIGWMNDLENLRIDDVKAWYQAWYSPNNATLVVAGDVDPEQVFALVERYFGQLPARPLPKIKPREEPVQLGTRRITVKAPAELPQLALAYRVPVLADIDRDWEPYALSVLSEILDGHDAARLPATLVRSQRVADQVGTSYDGVKRGAGLFVMSATPAAQHTPTDVERAWREQIQRLVDEGITEAEMKRVKAQVVASQIYQQDSVYGQASRLGRFDALGLPLDAVDRFIRKIQAVTAEQVRDVARRYLVDDRLTVAVLEPQPLAGARPVIEPHDDEDR
jgi:zinc protease